MSVSFCLPHPVAVSAFMICRGLCACTEMLWMCVLYVSFGSKVRPRTFGCVAMGSALLFIVRSRLLVYSAGSGVNRVQVVLSGFLTFLLRVEHKWRSRVRHPDTPEIPILYKKHNERVFLAIFFILLGISGLFKPERCSCLIDLG